MPKRCRPGERLDSLRATFVGTQQGHRLRHSHGIAFPSARGRYACECSGLVRPKSRDQQWRLPLVRRRLRVPALGAEAAAQLTPQRRVLASAATAVTAAAAALTPVPSHRPPHHTPSTTVNTPHAKTQ